jgi:Zn-dependent M28 family amino/carboxypeptidase
MPSLCTPRLYLFGLLVVMLLLAACNSATHVPSELELASISCAARVNNTTKALRECVTADGMLQHLNALQTIADQNNSTRVSGTAGFNQSADYAAKVFRDAGYTVTRQAFQFQTFIELPRTLLERVEPAPAGQISTRIFSYSGSGDVTAAVSRPVDAGSGNEGCEAADFAGFPAGHIALIQRGACAFAIKVTNAYHAGASAVVIWNNQPGIINGTLSNTFTLDIAVVAATQADGQELANLVSSGLMLRVKASTFRGTATTENIIAESRWGDPDNIVMAGAHLDSVAAGPGMNDNGSGSAAILEIARQMARVKPVNKVRFALWGAEESGLVGSNYYVNNLPEVERQKIALYLNFDMVASPNYVRFVYDGDNSAFPVGPGAALGPAGSGQIEQLFHDYFASVNLASSETPFSGRSDYGRFIFYGIPAGGLFTGAEGMKTVAEAAVYGGVADAAYDPCYHQACDALSFDLTGDPLNRGSIFEALNATYRMVGNVNLDALEEMGDAAAFAILTYAFDTRTVNGDGKGHPVSPPGQNGQGSGSGSSTDSGGGLHPDDHDHELEES